MSKLKSCPYLEKCYRKNPIHFGEFSHPHLDNIYNMGLDPKTNQYNIPTELSSNGDIILQQIKLLEKLFPKDSSKPKKKEENPQGSSTSQQRLSTDTYKASEKRSKSPQPTSSRARQASDDSNLAKKQKITRNIKEYIPVVVEKGQMAKKLEVAAKYNFFLTAITDAKPTHNETLTITMQEIFDESLGIIESTFQINFMVDIGWLLGHYYFAGILNTPLLVLYGDDTPELQTIDKHKPQVTAIRVKMPTPFATSHSKVMLLGYKDGSMRVVVSTANLYEDDWHKIIPIMDTVEATNLTEPQPKPNRKGSGVKSKQRGDFQRKKNAQFQAELQASILKRLKISDPTNLDQVQLQKSSPPQKIPITLRGLPSFTFELWERMKAIGTRPFANLSSDENRSIFLKCLLYIAESRVCYAQQTCGRNPVFPLTSLTTFTEMQLRSIRLYSSRLPTPLVIYMEAIGNITANKQTIIPCEMTTAPEKANGAVSFFPSSISTLLTECTADNPTDGVLMNIARRLSELPNIVWVTEQRHCPAIAATATQPAQPERNFEVAHISPISRNFWRFPNITEWTLFSKIVASMESKKDFILQFDVSTGLGSQCQLIRFPDEYDNTETETLYYSNVEISEFDEKLSGALMLGLEHGSDKSGRFTSSYDKCLSHGSLSQCDIKHAVIWANN